MSFVVAGEGLKLLVRWTMMKDKVMVVKVEVVVKKDLWLSSSMMEVEVAGSKSLLRLSVAFVVVGER
jgi:hypothetical protein